RQVRIARALLSVDDKAGLVDFARALSLHRIELWATGGTHAFDLGGRDPGPCGGGAHGHRLLVRRARQDASPRHSRWGARSPDRGGSSGAGRSQAPLLRSRGRELLSIRAPPYRASGREGSRGVRGYRRCHARSGRCQEPSGRGDRGRSRRLSRDHFRTGNALRGPFGRDPAPS
ncbi:hypothetical protein B1A_14015, partial [mine drainage metagenome]